MATLTIHDSYHVSEPQYASAYGDKFDTDSGNVFLEIDALQTTDINVEIYASVALNYIGYGEVYSGEPEFEIDNASGPLLVGPFNPNRFKLSSGNLFKVDPYYSGSVKLRVWKG